MRNTDDRAASIADNVNLGVELFCESIHDTGSQAGFDAWRVRSTDAVVGDRQLPVHAVCLIGDDDVLVFRPLEKRA